MAYQLTLTPAIFPAIADSTRRAILDRLRREDLAVRQIAEGFRVTRPAISQHLRILEDAGLVRGQWFGRRRVYTLNAAPLARVDEWLRAYRVFWERNLQSLKEFVEEESSRELAGPPKSVPMKRASGGQRSSGRAAGAKSPRARRKRERPN